MTWKIEPREGFIVATMRSNVVNKINADFFADVDEFVDEVERAHADRPIVLRSGTDKAFCAGLDFDHVFPIFAGDDRDALRAFVRRFREIFFRLFSLPNPVVAVVEGPAIAGGFILMCCADHRIADRERARFAVNEVPIGIAMPAAFTELIRHTVGAGTAERLVLSGRFLRAEEAHGLGVVDALADTGMAMSAAVDHVREIHADSILAYKHTKTFIREPVIERCRSLADRYDDSLLVDALTAEESKRRRAEAREELLGGRRAGE